MSWLQWLFLFFFVLGLLGSAYLFLTAKRPQDSGSAAKALLERNPGLVALQVKRHNHVLLDQNSQATLPLGDFWALLMAHALMGDVVEGWSPAVRGSIEELLRHHRTDPGPAVTRTLLEDLQRALGEPTMSGFSLEERLLGPLGMSATQAKAGIWHSTVADLMRFVDSTNSNRIVRMRSLNAMTSLEGGDVRSGWGLGVWLDQSYGLDRLSFVAPASDLVWIARRLPGPWFHYVLVFRGSQAEAELFAAELEAVYLGREVPARERPKP
jgi:hypothetical protein